MKSNELGIPAMAITSSGELVTDPSRLREMWEKEVAIEERADIPREQGLDDD